MRRGCFVWTLTPPLSGQRTPRPGPARVRVCVISWPGRAARPPGGVLVRLTFSCARSWFSLCLLGPLRAGVALLVVFPAFFPSAPPLSPAFPVFRRWVPPALASCAPPPPLFFFLSSSSAPPLSPAFRVFRPWVPWALRPPPSLDFLFFFFFFSRAVVCRLCRAALLSLLGSGACWCVLLWALCVGWALRAVALRRSVPPACASSFCVVACCVARALWGRAGGVALPLAASGVCRLCPPPPPAGCVVLCCASSCLVPCGAAVCGASCVLPGGVWGACVRLGSCAVLFGAVLCRAVLCCFCPALLPRAVAFSDGSGRRAGSGLFLFLCSACAVLCWCACVVALCAVLSCPCGAGWCFVLLPVVFACLLFGLAVLCYLLVGPSGSWDRVSAACYGVSLGAVLRCVAARCAASVWCCRTLCCVLGRCPSSCGPAPSGAVFCLVPSRCVCFAVVCRCVVLFAVVLCAVCTPGWRAVRFLSSLPCAVLLCGPLSLGALLPCAVPRGAVLRRGAVASCPAALLPCCGVLPCCLVGFVSCVYVVSPT